MSGMRVKFKGKLMINIRVKFSVKIMENNQVKKTKIIFKIRSKSVAIAIFVPL